MNYDNMRIVLSGATLDCRIEGTNQPTVMLLHGLNAHSGSWRKNVPVIARNRRVVAPSLPSFGSKGTLYELAKVQTQLLAELIDALEIGSATLVGNSLGGLVSMLYSVNHSEIVCAVVLEDTAGFESKELFERFHRTRIPTLIVWGERDLVIPLEAARRLRRELPRSELIILKNAAHVPHWEAPDCFNKLLLAFLDKTGC